MKRITKGLDIPIANPPEQKISDGPEVSSVALMGADYVGMKPTLKVREGDSVKCGQILFQDRKTPGVLFTAPVSGTVTEINRGAKRVFQSLVIEPSGEDGIEFPALGNRDVDSLSRDETVSTLVESGLWTALRTRPFSRVPSPESTPHSLFITATDTNPLCAVPEVVISQRPEDFLFGVQILRALTDGDVFLVSSPGVTLPGEDLPGIRDVEFEGPHPAGLVGTHIHFLDPVGPSKTVWHIGYQDVIEVGHLFRTGRLDPSRVISLAGPGVRNPRLIRTVRGAELDSLTRGELIDGDLRVISGSVLSGRTCDEINRWLGRYHLQVSVIAEGREREFLGWQKPGLDRFSIKRVFASAFLRRGERLPMTTSTGGSRRAMVPIGMYEAVMPLDILPTFLLRALITDDTEQAASLGALELDEEDLALCTFACPGKYEYGPMLRRCLTTIEREG